MMPIAAIVINSVFLGRDGHPSFITPELTEFTHHEHPDAE